MMGDYQVRFCERLGLKCPCLLDCANVGRHAENLGIAFEKHLLSLDKNIIYGNITY